MNRCWALFARLLLGFVLAALILTGPAAVSRAQDGIFVVESQPDAAALYLGDMAYIRDTLTVPAGMAARVLLPASTMRDSLVITEDGQRIARYRLGSTDHGSPTVTWDVAPGEETREIVLAYLISGMGWSPRYTMAVLDETRVQFGFEVEIHNNALDLSGVDLRLVAGMAGADPNYRPDMTVTQMNVLYDAPQTSAPVMGGAVAINHVYDIGAQTLAQGEILRWNLFDDTLDARRLLVWDARFGQRTDVIYKVLNSSEIPFVEGAVYAYENDLFVGQDAIEWTPGGSEGSVTIGGLSTVRVRRTESVEETGTFEDDRYLHTVVLAVTNHSDADIELTILDEWNPRGLDFDFSAEPTRQGNNVLRWEPTIPAGAQLEITYTYVID